MTTRKTYPLAWPPTEKMTSDEERRISEVPPLTLGHKILAVGFMYADDNGRNMVRRMALEVDSIERENQDLRRQLEEKTREVERQRSDAEKASGLIGRAQPWFREALAIVVDAPEFEGGCETQTRLRNLIEDALAPLVEARWTLETMAPADKDGA